MKDLLIGDEKICKNCQNVIKHKLNLVNINAYECKIIGRPVNPEMKPPNCYVWERIK